MIIILRRNSVQEPGLLAAEDLTYLGAFRVPTGTLGDSSFSESHAKMAYNPANDSLFITGAEDVNLSTLSVGEISIPTITTGAIGSLNTATVLQDFVDVVSQCSTQPIDQPNLGGLLIDGTTLIGGVFRFYDASGTITHSHLRLSSLDLDEATVTGLFQCNNFGGGYVGGYMCHVPTHLQSAFGSNYLTGQAGISIISRTSCGPAAFGFNPANFGGSPFTVQPYVYYTLDNPLGGNVEGQNNYFNLSTDITGIAIPDHTNTVLFWGGHGTGQYWYGQPDDVSPNDTAREHQGSHAPPYELRFWAYDAADLIAAKNGSLDPEELEPYGIWAVELPYESGACWPGGMCYDAANKRLFCAARYHDSASRPVIHVYGVA